jgi:hypothetical protein
MRSRFPRPLKINCGRKVPKSKKHSSGSFNMIVGDDLVAGESADTCNQAFVPSYEVHGQCQQARTYLRQ